MLIDDESGVNETNSDETPSAENLESKVEGAEPTPAPETETPAKGADDTGAEKTYSQAEVNEIMHKRTKDYSAMQRDLETYRAYISEQKAKPAPAPAQAPTMPELDEDDKKFVDYLKKVMPGINRTDQFSDAQKGFIERLQAKEEFERKTFTESAEGDVFKFCDTINAKDDGQKAVVRDAVAAVILNDAKLAEKWERRDPSVISDAIKVLETTLGKRSEVSANQNLSSVKARVEKIQQPFPKGGIPAPITKPKVYTEDERVAMAWESLQKKV